MLFLLLGRRISRCIAAPAPAQTAADNVSDSARDMAAALAGAISYGFGAVVVVEVGRTTAATAAADDAPPPPPYPIDELSRLFQKARVIDMTLPSLSAIGGGRSDRVIASNTGGGKGRWCPKAIGASKHITGLIWPSVTPVDIPIPATVTCDAGYWRMHRRSQDVAQRTSKPRDTAEREKWRATAT